MGEQQLTSNNKREILNKAFDFMLPALPVFVGNTLKGKNNWWQNYIYNKLPSKTVRDLPRNGTFDDIKRLDISLCIKIIISNWQEIFRRHIEDIRQSWVHELLEIRNDVSHWTLEKSNSYTFERINHTLSTMILFMRSIDPVVAEQIEKIKQAFEDKYKKEKNPPQKTKKETIKEVKKNEDIKYNYDYWKNNSSEENFSLVNDIMKIIKKIDGNLELRYEQKNYIGIGKNERANLFIKLVPKENKFFIRIQHSKNGDIDKIIKENFKEFVYQKDGNYNRYKFSLSKRDIDEKRNVLKDLIRRSYNEFNMK